MRIYLKKNNEYVDVAESCSGNDFALKNSCEYAVAMIVNDKLCDLTILLKNKDIVEFVSIEDEKGLSILRHSAAHILAMAIQKLYPGAKLATGFATENGFFYDIYCETSISVDDLPVIQKEIQNIIKRKLPFKKIDILKKDAIQLFQSNQFKMDIINDITDDFISIYYIGEKFIDLCHGPHILHTGCVPNEAYKLLDVSGVYWRGDSSGQKMQRIYGTAWPSIEKMQEYFVLLDKSKACDHRKLGPQLGIFHLDDSSPGSVFWLQKGVILFNTVKNYIAKVVGKYGYEQVQTPTILNKFLWERSGHWEKFRENMFIVQDEAMEQMAIKPMNCPGHIIVYQTGAVKSYRDLPYRMAEFGTCYRNESSGALHGLLRLRAFMQDDGHVFCTQEQIISETISICAAIKEIYNTFGFKEIKVKFSDRPEKRVGSDEIWDMAEKSLQEAADKAGLIYTINKGDGAFYGPKLEFILKDSLGREWQCGTLQVDFVLPERFDLSYIKQNGQKQQPVMLHRALVGSLERFIGILIENYAGALPFWLTPVQIVVATVTENVVDYAKIVYNNLLQVGFRAQIDIENEKISYKIRRHSEQKIPAIIILGKNEAFEETVSIRLLGAENTEKCELVEMIAYFAKLLK